MSQFPSSLWRPWGLVGTSSITYAFSPSPPPPPLLTIFKSPRPSLVLFLAVTTPLLLFLQTCSAIDFQPITYATCAVLGTRLYVIGGQTDILVSSSYTSQVATISLTDSFDGDHPPWDFMFSSFATARAPGVEARDQRRIILGGNVNNGNHAPAIAFDTNTQSWIQAPDLPGSGVGGGGATSRMQNYTRIGSGLAMDISNGVLIEFGGANATGPTNELNILETSRSTSDPAVGIAMSWYYSGVLSNVPGLYAPIVLYLPNLRMTLIMGGCDQMDLLGNPTSCVKFDKVYTLASESVTSIVPTAKQISTTAGEEIQNEEDGTINNNNTATTIANIPQPRVWSCAVVMKDGNVLMVGGGDPTSPLADSWRLDVTTWKWYRQPIENFPVEGIMGHGCEMAARGQVIVIGGHHGDRFVDRPISIIQLEDWSWTDKFEVSGFSTGIKIGLSLSIVVVVGAIVAGLVIRRQRIRKTRDSTSVKTKFFTSCPPSSSCSSTPTSLPSSGPASTSKSQLHHHGRNRSSSGRSRREHHHHHREQTLDGAERGEGQGHGQGQESRRQSRRQSSGHGLPRHSRPTMTTTSANEYPMTNSPRDQGLAKSFSGPVSSMVVSSDESPAQTTSTQTDALNLQKPDAISQNQR